jgi:hypothetical protein
VSAIDAKRLEELMKSPSQSVFDDVHRSVFYLMKSDSFPRFKRDPLFSRLAKRLKKRDFVNYKTVLGNVLLGCVCVKFLRNETEIAGNLGYWSEKR